MAPAKHLVFDTAVVKDAIEPLRIDSLSHSGKRMAFAGADDRFVQEIIVTLPLGEESRRIVLQLCDMRRDGFQQEVQESVKIDRKLQLFEHCRNNGLYLFRIIHSDSIDIHTDTNHNFCRGCRKLRHQYSFAEDAGDFFAAKIHIVWPFNFRMKLKTLVKNITACNPSR